MAARRARAGRGRASESGMAQRRAERRGAERRGSDRRWATIREAGSRVFRRLGYAQATLEDVAGELGIHRASLYYYVADKAELLVAILGEPVRRMTRDLREIHGQGGSAETRLRRAVAQHMRALDENHPELFVFLAENLHLLPIGGDGDLRKSAREYGELLTAIVVEGVEAGEFRDDLDPRLVMLGTIGMLNWSHRWYRPDGAKSLPEIGEQFANLVLAGLLRPRTSN